MRSRCRHRAAAPRQYFAGDCLEDVEIAVAIEVRGDRGAPEGAGGGIDDRRALERAVAPALEQEERQRAGGRGQGRRICCTTTSTTPSPVKSPNAPNAGKVIRFKAVGVTIAGWNVPSPRPGSTEKSPAESVARRSRWPSPLKSPTATESVLVKVPLPVAG